MKKFSRRSFLSSMLLAPVAVLVPLIPEPKLFWAGTTIPRHLSLPDQYSKNHLAEYADTADLKEMIHKLENITGWKSVSHS